MDRFIPKVRCHWREYELVQKLVKHIYLIQGKGNSNVCGRKSKASEMQTENIMIKWKPGIATFLCFSLYWFWGRYIEKFFGKMDHLFFPYVVSIVLQYLITWLGLKLRPLKYIYLRKKRLLKLYMFSFKRVFALQLKYEPKEITKRFAPIVG